MRRRTLGTSLVALAVISMIAVGGCDKQKNKQTTSSDAPLASVNGMRSLDDFSSIKDDRERALAIYQEIDAVLSHPRCVNCHPAGDSPYRRRPGDLGPPHRDARRRGSPPDGATGSVFGLGSGSLDTKLRTNGEEATHRSW